jgi:hypothetical protein
MPVLPCTRRLLSRLWNACSTGKHHSATTAVKGSQGGRWHLLPQACSAARHQLGVDSTRQQSARAHKTKHRTHQLGGD